MNRFNSIDDLKEIQVFNNFFKLTEIPRPSFKEKKVSDFLKNWAEKLNLDVRQDDNFNLLILKASNFTSSFRYGLSEKRGL